MIHRNGFIHEDVPRKPHRKYGIVMANSFGWVLKRTHNGVDFVELLVSSVGLVDKLASLGFDEYGNNILENGNTYIEKTTNIVEPEITEKSSNTEKSEDSDEPEITEKSSNTEKSEDSDEPEITTPVVCIKADNFGCTEEFCRHAVIHEKGECGSWHECDKIEGEEPFKVRCQKA